MSLFSLIEQLCQISDRQKIYSCIKDVEWSNKRANATLPASATHPDGMLSLKDGRCHDNSRTGRGLSAGILIRAVLDIKLRRKPETSRMSLAPLIIKPEGHRQMFRRFLYNEATTISQWRETRCSHYWSPLLKWTHDTVTVCSWMRPVKPHTAF